MVSSFLSSDRAPRSLYELQCLRNEIERLREDIDIKSCAKEEWDVVFFKNSTSRFFSYTSQGTFKSFLLTRAFSVLLLGVIIWLFYSIYIFSKQLIWVRKLHSELNAIIIYEQEGNLSIDSRTTTRDISRQKWKTIRRLWLYRRQTSSLWKRMDWMVYFHSISAIIIIGALGGFPFLLNYYQRNLLTASSKDTLVPSFSSVSNWYLSGLVFRILWQIVGADHVFNVAQILIASRIGTLGLTLALRNIELARYFADQQAEADIFSYIHTLYKRENLNPHYFKMFSNPEWKALNGPSDENDKLPIHNTVSRKNKGLRMKKISDPIDSRLFNTRNRFRLSRRMNRLSRLDTKCLS